MTQWMGCVGDTHISWKAKIWKDMRDTEMAGDWNGWGLFFK